MRVPTGNDRMLNLKRKSTKSLPASANKTFWDFGSTRSFKLTVVAAMTETVRNQDFESFSTKILQILWFIQRDSLAITKARAYKINFVQFQGSCDFPIIHLYYSIKCSWQCHESPKPQLVPFGNHFLQIQANFGGCHGRYLQNGEDFDLCLDCFNLLTELYS